MADKNKTLPDGKTVLERNRGEVASFYSYYSNNIERARRNRKFLYVTQWGPDEFQSRDDNNKTTMTMNLLKPTVRGMLGYISKNLPAISFTLNNPKGPQKSVNFLNDMFRGISAKSNLDYIQEVAVKDAIVSGWGAYRCSVEYVDSDSFELEVKYHPIEDCFMAYFDPDAREDTRCDGNFAGYYYTLSREEFKETYSGVQDPTSIENLSSPATTNFYWYTKDEISIVHHFRKEYFRKTIVDIGNNQSMDLSEYNQMRKFMEAEGYPEYQIPQIYRRRKVTDYKIMHYKMIANEILEQEEWPSKVLPVFYVKGQETTIDGQVYTVPFIDDMQDCQRSINTILSEIMDNVISSRREKFMVTPDNIRGFEMHWRKPEQLVGALPANPDKKTGQMPIPVNPPPFNPQLLEFLNELMNYMRMVTARYEESRGEESNAVSGKAVHLRQTAANEHLQPWILSLNNAARQAALCALSLLPSTYTERNRIVPSINEAGSTQPMIINQVMGPGYYDQSSGSIKGEELRNEIPPNMKGIEVYAGKNYQMQQVETLDNLYKMVAASGDPNVFKTVSDVIGANLPIQQSQTIASRFRQMYVPPDIVAEEEGKPPPPPQESPQEQQRKFENQMEIVKAHQDQQKIDMENRKVYTGLVEQQMRVEQSEIDRNTQIIKTIGDNRNDAIKAVIDIDEQAEKHAERQTSQLMSLLGM